MTKFPIRFKILVGLSVIIIAAVAFYLYLASQIFFEDKTLLVYELNENNVRTLAVDLEANIKKIFDKTRLFAILAEKSHGSRTITEVLNLFSADEDDFVRVTLYGDPEAAPLFEHTWPKYLEVYGKKAGDLDSIRHEFPVPFARVIQNGSWVRNVTSSPSSPPLMTIAIPINSGKAAQVFVADVRLDRILESFKKGGISEVYAMDSDGFALDSPKQISLQNDPLLSRAIGSKLRTEVRQFSDHGKSYLGSYYQVGIAGLAVASRVERDEAWAAARLLVRKSLIYALIVVTAAFLVALFFSHTLTEPIRHMVEATQRIAGGDFSNLLRVTSRDELAVLASSFNSMTVNLKASREQIVEQNRDLEKKVEERTVKLEAQNVAIKETQEALMRTTRLASVGETAGRAAHEVLNPLTNIIARLEKTQLHEGKLNSEDLKLLNDVAEAWKKSFASGGIAQLVSELSAPSQAQPGKMLLEEDLDNITAVIRDLSLREAEKSKDTEFLLREANRISKIVNGMRQLTRVSSTRSKIDIHSALEEAAATMRDVLNKKKIKIELGFCSAKPWMISDHDEMLQILSNLIRNSMQAIETASHTSPKQITITTAIAASERGPRIHIRISDNGPGIPPELFQTIFEPSFTTKTPTEGTGLGLAITRRFIRASNGEITVEKSIPEVETTFLIDFPEFQLEENA